MVDRVLLQPKMIANIFRELNNFLDFKQEVLLKMTLKRSWLNGEACSLKFSDWTVFTEYCSASQSGDLSLDEESLTLNFRERESKLYSLKQSNSLESEKTNKVSKTVSSEWWSNSLFLFVRVILQRWQWKTELFRTHREEKFNAWNDSEWKSLDVLHGIFMTAFISSFLFGFQAEHHWRKPHLRLQYVVALTGSCKSFLQLVRRLVWGTH